ncbi:putative 4-coumarate--CoA ligase [Erysiphe necator]|uniref:Putative 4-coumarate-ligase n=1 Tax=Uncinula necator TaxID=52586 RepID=A0A0B1P7K8_UNCNE|nr:putative 4-coumarate--CoA ligase [Erysiphe necator]KHJ33285.1 putative 4-coumarate- ligase [Erysiphe necator]
MPIRSTYKDVHIPNVDLWTFLFERRDREFPDQKVILIDSITNRSYTFGQVERTALEFGKNIKAIWNWKCGDVLAVYSPNCVDIPSIIWGTLWAGGVLSPSNPNYTLAELVFQLKDSGAKALVTQKSCLAVAKKACQEVGIDSSRIILIGDEKDDCSQFKHFKDFLALKRSLNVDRTTVDPKKDLAFLVYSSGTTGRPKGVMLSHSNIVSDVLMAHAIEEGKLRWNGGVGNDGDKTLGFLPFFHIYGLLCIVHHSTYLGLCMVVIEKFDFNKFCAAIQNYRITYANVVPPIVLLLAKSPIVSRYDLSSLRMLNSGAAPLTRELVEALYARIKVPVKQGYGLSETSPVTHLQSWENWYSTIGSVGSLLPNLTAKYVSEDGKEVPVGHTGELWVKGPNVFLGYINNVEATQNAITEDGYFKTGDVGYQDKSGNFYITDRSKELIKYKGFQVAPAELEGLLITHPNIEDAAVIGIQDNEQATELPRAYVVLRRDVAPSGEAEKIMNWLKERVANHKQLRGGVRFVKEIPKTNSGKILRRVLKEQARAEKLEVQRQSKL